MSVYVNRFRLYFSIFVLYVFRFAVPAFVAVTSGGCDSAILVAVPFIFLIISLLLAIGTSILALTVLNKKLTSRIEERNLAQMVNYSKLITPIEQKRMKTVLLPK